MGKGSRSYECGATLDIVLASATLARSMQKCGAAFVLMLVLKARCRVAGLVYMRMAGAGVI